MLELTIPSTEYYNSKTEEFIDIPGRKIRLEHSLVSLSKWESIWEKPFLGGERKSNEELRDYIRCMSLDDISDNHLSTLVNSRLKEIEKYIESKMTATWFSEAKVPGQAAPKKETLTAEILYYYMIAQNIPMECQHWHLNRLITLIKVCALRNQPPKKMDRKTSIDHIRSLNQARRAQYNTKG